LPGSPSPAQSAPFGPPRSVRPFRLVITGHFTGLEGKFTLQASGRIDAYVGTQTVNSSLNFADLLTSGSLRVTLGIWLALLPLALVLQPGIVIMAR
jgi:hypothetical protein